MVSMIGGTQCEGLDLWHKFEKKFWWGCD